MPEVAAVAVPSVLLSADWRGPMVNETSWLTSVTEAISTDESRRGQMDRPYRTIKNSAVTLERDQVGAFQVQLRKHGQGRFWMPVWSDRSETTAAAIATATTISVNTVDRRFFVGYYALVMVFDMNLRATIVHAGKIASLTTNSITFEAPSALPVDIPKGAVVCPAIEADIVMGLDGQPLNDRFVQYSLEFREKTGKTALPALAAPGSLPDGEPTYQGIPVLTIPHNWTNPSLGQLRKGALTPVGIDLVPVIYGSRPVSQQALNFTRLRRADSFRLLRFVDSRGGRTFSFWLPGPTDDLVLDSKTSDTVWVFKKTISAADLQAQRFIAFVLADGTTLIRTISAVVDGATLSATIDALTATFAQVVRVSFAYLARFDEDSITESWSTDETMTTSLKMTELQANNCGTGERGDGNCADDDFPDINPPNTNETEEPWEIEDANCQGSFGDVACRIPMWCDSTAALNSLKEPIRGADCSMPSFIPLRFLTDELTRDTNHSWGFNLSAEFFTALAGEGAHRLAYLGAVDGYSRHWQHIRWQGTDPFIGWSMPSDPFVPVKRHTWKLVINYTVSGTPHTIDLRVVAEVPLSNAAGLWGTGVFFRAFCSEVNPTYVDGTDVDGIPFTLDDPCVWGAMYSLGTGEKRCHPRMVLCGNVPTTLDAPVGTEFVPRGQEHKAPCYVWQNGAPWVPFDVEGRIGVVRNIVFGTDIGGYDMAAMTLGGNVPISKLMQWVIVENKTATGLTYLKPARSGRSETEGNIDIAGGTSVEFYFCNPGQDDNKVDVCHGHPDEPLEGIGGSHKCFKTWHFPGGVCVSTSGVSTLGLVEQCRITTTVVDGDCDIDSQTCSASPIHSNFTLALEDYTYLYGGNQELRTITWLALEEDRSYVRQGFTYNPEDTDFSDLSEERGTWDFGTGVDPIECETVAIAVPSAMLTYTPPGDGLEDSEQEVVCVVDDVTIPLGVACNVGTDAGGLTAICLILVPSAFPGGAEARIKIRTLGEWTTLVETDGLTIQSGHSVKVKLIRNGAYISATIRNLDTDDDEVSLSTENCYNFVGRNCSLIQENTTTAGAKFTGDGTEELPGWKITDLNKRKVEVRVTLTKDGLSSTIDPKACDGYGQCEGELLDPDCPGDCPCTSVFGGKVAIYSSSGTSVSVATYGRDEESPAQRICAAPGCFDPNDPSCNQCPKPFLAIDISLPDGCGADFDTSTFRFRTGSKTDYWQVIACE